MFRGLKYLMAVKLALLKSGEEVVSDIKEARDKESDTPIYYIFKNPVRVELIPAPQDPELLTEGEEPSSDRKEAILLSLDSLSADTEMVVDVDWVVTVVEPHEQVLKSYTEKIGV